jgi:hypothetical protein
VRRRAAHSGAVPASASTMPQPSSARARTARRFPVAIRGLSPQVIFKTGLKMWLDLAVISFHTVSRRCHYFPANICQTQISLIGCISTVKPAPGIQITCSASAATFCGGYVDRTTHHMLYAARGQKLGKAVLGTILCSACPSEWSATFHTVSTRSPQYQATFAGQS